MGNRHLNPLPNNMNLNGEGNEQNLIPVEEQNQIIQERATTKKILAVRLPVYLKKQTLKFQQDAVFQEKCYIKFNYDSLVNLDCYINFNVTQKTSSQNIHTHDKKKHKLSYSPSLNLTNKGIFFQNLPSGENVEFFNKEAFLDLNYYLVNKAESANSYDLSIEFVPIFPPGSPELADNNEIVFVTLCNFEKHKLDNKYEIKCALQRIRTHGIWIDFHDIFDSSLDGGLCLICCSAVRNTVFLPCKHAACCDKCGSEIKLRFKPCPICKTPIDDLLIIDSDEKKFENDLLDIDENIIDDNKFGDEENAIIQNSSQNESNNDINTNNINNRINNNIDNNIIIINNNNNENNDKNKNNNNTENNSENNNNNENNINNENNNIILNNDDDINLLIEDNK